MTKLLSCAFVVAAFASMQLVPSAGATVPYPHLDRNFGTGGYVALPAQLPAPTSDEVQVENLAAAPDGAVYVTESSPQTCNGEICHSRGYLSRVNSDGSIATTFGGSGRVQVGKMVGALSPPLSDSEGRVLVASQEGSSVTVHRYLADGAVDTSFGTAGTTTFGCGCGYYGRQLLLAIDHQERIVVSINVIDFGSSTSSEALARLLPSGEMDGSFGGGVVQAGTGAPPMGIAFGPNDEIYIWATDCCQPESLLYLHRVLASGLVDSEFNARSDQALVDVATRGVARGVISASQMALIVRHGRLDLYGGGWLVRMRTDGDADMKFGQGAIRQLRWRVLTPSLVAHGKVLALGSTPFGVNLLRMQPNGQLDRSFGKGGALSIEGVNAEGAEDDISLARLQGRRVQILDKRYPSCGVSCTVRLKLVRYRIGPRG